MENNHQTAGKTAKINLTDEQQERLIEASKRLATVNYLVNKTEGVVAKECVFVFNGPSGKIVPISANAERKTYYDAKGYGFDILCSPGLLECIHEFFVNEKNTILEEIFGIYQEGGAE